jgi:hypothetical protein
MLPKRLPMVSTGQCNACATAVDTNKATKGPGMRRLNRGQINMIANASTLTATAYGFTE